MVCKVVGVARAIERTNKDIIGYRCFFRFHNAVDSS